MQSKSSKPDPASPLASFINGSLNDFNSLTAALKSPSRTTSQMNHNLKNKLLLANQGESKTVVRQILTHLLRIAQIKGVHNIVLSILGKVIGFVKVLYKMGTNEPLLERNQEMGEILSSIIDITVLMKNHYKQADITLRIIQATFSIIDQKLLQFANYNALSRIYSVCFECCESNQMIQNISVSALYSLTQIVFSSQKTKDSICILSQMLEYLFNGKKFLWIKDKDLNGMVWDLVNIAIKSFPIKRLEELFSMKEVAILLVKMYNLSAEKAFTQTQDAQKSMSLNKSFSKEQNQRNINFKKGYFPDFVRFYKTFIYFSIYLYFRANSNEAREVIPFRENFYLFKSLYETARNSKLYLLLEGASLLLNESSYILIEEQQGIILIDVFNKVCEELDRSQRPLEFHTDKGELYLEKLCGDFNKISDNQFATIIKNTILRLRRNFQNENHELRQNKVLQQKSILENSVQQQQKRPTASLKKRWQRLIKIVLKIIKHLTSLNLKEGSNEQIVRKLVGQLQYWIIICPTNKLKNIILQELLLTSMHLDTRIQSIKASQCLQIGSNIIYGYYDSLDTFGLAIILRMIAGIQVSWQQGKGFDQLEEVCTMTEKLYTEQQLVHSQESFTKTIQAFAQCLNGLLADFEQPAKGDSKQSKNHHRKHIERYHKMITYILAKIESILHQSSLYIEKQWDFLTGFWISLASNKNVDIKKNILSHLLPIIVFIIKNTHLSQESIILLYQQLAKLSSIQISKAIISHLKQILLSLSSQNAILQTFKTLSIILQAKGIEIIHQQLYQFLQTIIRQSLFQIKSMRILINIIDHINFIGKDKSQEYKVVNLIWHISDHLKTLKENHEDEESKEAWMHLVRKIIHLAEITDNGETKQSCIHAFTQIIAESVRIIEEDLFLAILGKQYMEIFSILMNFTNDKESNAQAETKSSQTVQVNKQVAEIQAKILNIDMIRNGIKNFIRITRKCLSINIQVSRSMFMEAFSRIRIQLNEKKVNTMEYIVEINAFLQYFQQILQVEQYSSLNLKDQIITLFSDIQNNHQLVDKTTYTWKKYKTAFEEIKASFVPA